MDYLNFYSFKTRGISKQNLKQSKFYRKDKAIYNFLFIFNGKILMKNNNPFLYFKKYKQTI